MRWAPLLGGALIAGAIGARAQTLPPDRPTTAYTIEFEFERFEAGYSEKGRRRMSVDGDLVRDQAIGAKDGAADDPSVYIADRAKGTVIEFDPADPQRQYRVSPMGELVMPMADGYASLRARQGPPRLLGPGQILGLACARLGWQGQGADRQEWCVTAQGIVLQAERRAGLTGTRLKAVRLEIGAADPALFRPPPGFWPAPSGP